MFIPKGLRLTAQRLPRFAATLGDECKDQIYPERDASSRCSDDASPLWSQRANLLSQGSPLARATLGYVTQLLRSKRIAAHLIVGATVLKDRREIQRAASFLIANQNEDGLWLGTS